MPPVPRMSELDDGLARRDDVPGLGQCIDDRAVGVRIERRVPARVLCRVQRRASRVRPEPVRCRPPPSRRRTAAATWLPS